MKKFRCEQQQYDSKVNPSFSSSLLDEIYRSIDDGEKRSGESKFYRETTKMAVKGQSKSTGRKTAHGRRAIEEEEIMANLHRACLIEKWMEKKINERVRKPFKHFDHDHEQDALFFSSTSISSDSSSGGIFSPSDNESMSGTKTKKHLSYAPSQLPVRPKPIRIAVPARPEKAERKAKQREPQTSDRYHQQINDDILIKSKSRALKIYSNLKKVKQPISPGGKLTSFLNSLFATGQNTKKTTTATSKNVISLPSVTSSTCSSATSFSRSCLSKNSPSSREKLRNGVKRNVHFYPVSVIVDEDCRPCGHKSLYEDKSDLVREFQKKMNRTKNDLAVTRDFRHSYGTNHEDEDESDDADVASSCSSSDLFELDHLVLMGRKMYCEELPVYETTHINF